MLVSDIRVETAAEYCELRAEVSGAALAEPFSLWFRFPAAYGEGLRPDRGDPFVPALLLPAMRAGEPLEIRAPVSPRLLEATRHLQEVYASWDARLRRVAVRASVAEVSGAPRAAAPARALFFSLGVDSFYSLLRNVQEHPDDEETIGHLIMVRGFDVHVGRGDGAVFGEMLANAGEVAGALGKTLVPAATNLRELTDRFANWSLLAHGAGLASVGLALGDAFRAVHVAAGPGYIRPSPTGSHPLLDPWWSTEAVTLVYDSGHVRRLPKLGLVSQSSLAMRTLRVCSKNPPTVYNCGRCPKCLTAMALLDEHGLLGRCMTLPPRLNLDDVRRLRPKPGTEASTYRRIGDWLRRSKADPALADLFERRLERELARQVDRLREYRDREAWVASQARQLVVARAENARLRDKLDALGREGAALRQRSARLDAEAAALRRKLAGARQRNRRLENNPLARLGARYRRLRARAAGLLPS